MTADNTIFEDNSNSNPLETLVGEGKKYKTEAELAKGYVNADSHIKKLETEAAELRQELASRLAVEDAIKKITPAKTPERTETTTQKPPVDQPDVNELIRKALEDQTTGQLRDANVRIVGDTLIKSFGTTEKANEVVKQKANELGVPLKFLQDVASKSPQALFNILGLTEERRTETNSTRSDVNTTALTADRNNSNLKPTSYAFYKQMQLADPNKYYRRETQLQMEKLALERGDDFYK